MRDLAVEQNRILQVALQHAFLVELHRRDAHAFLEDVGMAAVGEIGMVRGVDGPADQPAVEEDRLRQHDIRQVRGPALIGVVADEHVARMNLGFGVALLDVRDDADEAAQMHWDVLGLAQRIAAPVEQGRGTVAPLLDVG